MEDMTTQIDSYQKLPLNNPYSPKGTRAQMTKDSHRAVDAYWRENRNFFIRSALP